MYIKVVLFSKSFSDEGITYFVPSFLEKKIKIWKIVIVPYMQKENLALVTDILEKNDFEEEKIKSIIDLKNDIVFLENYQVKLIKFLSKKYFTLIHNCLNLFFVKNLKDKIKKDKIFIWENNFLFQNKQKKEEKSKEIKEKKISFKLSEKQQEVFEKIKNSKNNKILFHWITWSWKTEIYIKIIEENLKNNKQTLLLVPEIILNSQIFERIKKFFQKDIVLINSTISEAKKTKIWLDIYNQKTKIIIGTRSAIFYPYKNLATIIVDEEHDNSYFSDKNPRYSSIDLVLKISELLNIKVILASWTPSINSMYKAIKKEFELISLMEKFKK